MFGFEKRKKKKKKILICIGLIKNVVLNYYAEGSDGIIFQKGGVCVKCMVFSELFHQARDKILTA